MLLLMNLSRRSLFVLSSLLIATLLVGCRQAVSEVLPTATQTMQLADAFLPSSTPNRTPTSDQKLSTPQLIDQSYIKGEITSEERLLYLDE